MLKQKPASRIAAGPPEYFGRVKASAARRWQQLEADPELAGPWHQLFKQVQSPRHILSELLQNADDAGATEARVSIQNQRFIFEHNGEDFVEAHFASICRFGYSNKRALHTIGFRGIGFKSTFSLGNRVELFSPTLSVAFDRVRFTEPHWIDDSSKTHGTTRIEVAIEHSRLCREVEKNLDEWLQSPVSLLFFKTIRRLQIGDRVVHWQSLGPGPVADSEWMSLDDKGDDAFLLLSSEEEAFPADALEEIRKERMLGAEDGGDFPPCRIEIVLGAKGRLYVVLPTGVETPLPFACNAPFIQDPARLKIKDPETSPTNRWLLERTGELAAKAMVEWLGQTKTGALDRAAAYGLLPNVDREASTLEGSCAAMVELAFADAVEDRPILLTDEGQLVAANAAIVIPPAIFDIWPAEQAKALLDEKSRPALSRHVSADDRTKLIHWNMVEEFTKSDLLTRLRRSHFPRPSTWRNLLNLWTYVASELTGWQSQQPEQVRIVPVQGKEVLYSASEVVRLGEKKLLQSDEDWEFLSDHLIVLNQNWTRFLAEQRRDKGDGDGRADPTEAAFAVLKKIGLDDTSDVNAVIERVAADFFGSSGIKLAECVQLAQIAAKLGATAGESFRYACTDRILRPITKAILYNEDGALEDLLPEHARQTQLLHSDYVASFSSCSREDWLRWVSSGRSGLQTFVPLTTTRKSIYGRQQAEAEAQRRGLSGTLYYPYVTSQFVVEDWDFPAECWRHWEALSKDDPQIWTKVAGRVLEQRDSFWSRSAYARLSQVATTGSTRSLTSEPLLADWILKLRSKPCLPDSRGTNHTPGDLLRRTPQTEALLDVEPFVHGLLDRETTRPLLELLGVRSAPAGPDRLLARLRALSGSDRAPPHEVEKWYRRLDQLFDEAATSDAQNIVDAFKSERLILAHDGSWVTSGAVFLASDEEDVPGAAIIRNSVQDLSLWRRIGIADRPSADLAIRWLSELQTGRTLPPDEARRVRNLMSRYPDRIWHECGHWMNLASEWVEASALSYGISMQSLQAYSHLHDWVKRKTADLRQLSAETVGNAPFNSLLRLSSAVEERLDQSPLFSSGGERRDWLMAFGAELARIELNDPVETERVRTIAEQIEKTVWITAPKLEVIPYIDGVPAGTSRQADILWLEDTLYVGPLTKAKLAKRVPEEIGKSLSAEIRAALAYAFERSSSDIKAYLEENFTLGVARVIANTHEQKPKEDIHASDQPDNTDAANTVAPADNSEHSTEPVQDVDDHSTNETHLQSDDADDSAAPDDDTLMGFSDPPNDRRPRTAAKPARPKLIQRFAVAHSFRPDGEGRFYKDDGSWIARTNGARFPWEHRAVNGDVIRYYYPREHCLENEPLQIEADIWSLLDQKPDLYAFILTSVDDKPVEVTGAELRTLRDEGGLSIHPATYRLVKSEAPT